MLFFCCLTTTHLKLNKVVSVFIYGYTVFVISKSYSLNRFWCTVCGQWKRPTLFCCRLNWRPLPSANTVQPYLPPSLSFTLFFLRIYVHQRWVFWSFHIIQVQITNLDSGLSTPACGRFFKEILPNRLSLTWDWPRVLSMAPIVQILNRRVRSELLSLIPITWISSKWMRASFLLTNSSQWSVLRYVVENETEWRGTTLDQGSCRRISG